MLHGKYRFYLLLRSENYKALVAIENYILQFKNVSADIDPIDFI